MRWMQWLSLGIASFFCLIGPPHILVNAQEAGVQVRGKIMAPAGQSLPAEGLPVVLLKFHLDEKGDLTTDGPMARSQSNGAGEFTFEKIPFDEKAAYRVGSRYQEELVSSEFFFMKSGEDLPLVELVIPGISEETQALQANTVSLFIEPNLGQVSITQVLSLENPTRDVIDTQKTPLVFQLPAQIQSFQMMEGRNSEKKSYEWSGETLKITKRFRPGNTTLFFQYLVPVTFGSLRVNHPLPTGLKEGRVFVPMNQLKLESPDLSATGPQNFEDTVFQSWALLDVNKTRLTFEVAGVPLKQQTYLYVALALLLVLGGLVFGFITKRLKNPSLQTP